MNREIKFRGKSLHTGLWHYGDLMQIKDACYIKEPLTAGFFTDPETIGQFTGLHDKNGKMIYQHDIIQLQGKENKYNCLVDWNINLGAWCLSIENKCLGVKPLGEWIREDSFIVIGNIFDNPELLEE